MSTQTIDGPALRKMVSLASKQSLSFAFCPGAKKDDVLLIDRKKPAPALAKEARNISSGKKVAFGRISADSKGLMLDCDNTLPNLPKQIRQYCKAQSVNVDVRMADPEADKASADKQTVKTTEAKPAADKAAKADLSKQLKTLALSAAKIGRDAQALAGKEARKITSLIKGNELDKAKEALAALQGQLEKMPVAAKSEKPKPEAKPASMKAARKSWADARRSVSKDVRSLIDGVGKAAGSEPGMAHAQREVARLTKPISQLDTRLETALAKLEAAASPAERKKLTAAARRQIKDHIALMNTEFFKAVDSSGFAATRIRDTVLKSLKQVNKALDA